MKKETIHATPSEIRREVQGLLAEFAEGEHPHPSWEIGVTPLLEELLPLTDSPIDEAALQEWIIRFDHHLTEHRIKGLDILLDMVQDISKSKGS